MTTLNFTINGRRPAVDLSVSRKDKLVLKPLKACKPGGQGHFASAALADLVCPALHVQGVRTDQWISTTAISHHA